MTRQTRQLLKLEPLEDRRLLSICHVTRLADTGAGTGLRGDLRYCINRVNDLPGPDTIDFKVTGTINLMTGLPSLKEDLVIVGPGGAQLVLDAQALGRVFQVYPTVTAQISDLSMKDGSADKGGGIFNQGNLKLEGVNITGNTSVLGQGGGIFNTGILAVSHSKLTGNTATSANRGFGGGIYNESGGTVRLSEVLVAQNIGLSSCSGSMCFNETAGGGVYNAANANLSIDRSIISDNLLSTGNTPNSNPMFGIGVFNAGSASIRSTSVLANTMEVFIAAKAQAYGGGVHNAGSSMVIVNSTIAGNHLLVQGGAAKVRGGGVFSSAGELTIRHTTIADNILTCSPGGTSDRKGGGIAIAGGAVHVQNTLVADNLVKKLCNNPLVPFDIFGALTSSSYNLFGESDGGSGFGSTDILDVNPLLGPLQDNGGPTQTMALLPGSPAIDAGDPNPIDPPEWDQRGPGYPRIVNGRLDIGAFEVQATDAPIPTNYLAILITADLENLIWTEGAKK